MIARNRNAMPEDHQPAAVRLKSEAAGKHQSVRRQRAAEQHVAVRIHTFDVNGAVFLSAFLLEDIEISVPRTAYPDILPIFALPKDVPVP